ncbi:MAG: 23S rRNA (uracil(1939)-C(5))-methyltransferase RlmD, partial [Clostridiales bacterium]|nr:23S rRNA (uracil(1939)-C(5))-methyltransferase RlmD [Clostridiales bacterium]
MSDKEILTADITALSSEGAGIGRSDGIAVFVPGALPGEKATVEVAARRKNYITARLLSRGAKSPDRVDPVCPHYAACGGCGIMHMSYAAQLRFKRDKVAAAVLRIGGSDIGVDDAVPSPDILRYRNKICLQVRAEADGAVKIGFFREGTHVVADIDDCPLFCGGAARVIEIFRRFLKSGGITAYREDGGTGLLKHIIIRRLDGVTIVTAVVTDAGEAAYGEIGEALRKEQGGGIVFYVNVNPAGGKILGAVTRAVTVGADSVRTVCGLKVSVSPESFFQVNDGVSARIYGDILLAAADIGPRAVIDAYCGAGLLTAMLASAVRKPTHGVEIVREAAADARALVKRNN